jgi:hypothetical protein
MIHPGAWVEVDFACERHAGAIEGRALDETGGPFRDLRVVLNRVESVKEPESGSRIGFHQPTGLALTGDDGSFAFRGLSGGKFVVSIETGPYLAVAPPGVNAVGVPFAPVDVDLGVDGQAHLDLNLRRSHPVHVRGSFDTNPGAAPSVFVVGRVPGGSGTVRWNVDGSRWRFDFYLEAAVVDPVLEVQFEGKKSSYPLALSVEAEPPPLLLPWPK